jgi:uncharacterized protein
MVGMSLTCSRLKSVWTVLREHAKAPEKSPRLYWAIPPAASSVQALHLPAPLNPSCEQSLTSVPLVVLDTNAVLDWTVFGDPGMARLSLALAAGSACWVTTAAMRAEFDAVLNRGLGRAWSADSGRIAEVWRLCRIDPAAPAAPLHCTDPDDQKFLDLALAIKARWLVSHDKALLRLKRPAAARSLTIVPPALWQPE